MTSSPNDKIKLTNYKNILPPDKKELWNKFAIDPDRELLEWDRWIKIRNDEITVLSKNTTKLPPDLVMNLNEARRDIQEWKVVLEHAQINKKPKLRGSTLWEQPPRLPQECCTDQVYEVHRTAAEKGRPRIIEHIGVPKKILEMEKGIIGDSERMAPKKMDVGFKNYKKKREQELEKNIKKIDPYKPQLSELMVRGRRPQPPPPPPPVLPLISVTNYVHTQKNNSTYYALRINNSLFYSARPDLDTNFLKKEKQKKFSDSCTTWFYYFNSAIKRIANGTLILENFGTVTLRYYWIKVIRNIPFIPDDSTEQVFFFNKNENVLSPGQTQRISLAFMSKDPGIFSEIWELHISNNVFLSNPSDKFLINLYGDAFENTDEIISSILQEKRKMKTIKNNHFIKTMLSTLIDKITTIKPQIYPYKHLLLESEIFVMKNPVCFYHQTEVGKLKTYYQEMMPGEEWDLSIVTWRSAMIDKSYEERMKYYLLLKESHKDLIKPWREECDLKTQKHAAVKLLIDSFAKKMDDEYSKLYAVTFSQPISLKKATVTVENEKIPVEMKNVFYLKVYEHLCDTIELAAGVLSSMDLNRWIEFDFCQYYCPCQNK